MQVRVSSTDKQSTTAPEDLVASNAAKGEFPPLEHATKEHSHPSSHAPLGQCRDFAVYPIDAGSAVSPESPTRSLARGRYIELPLSSEFAGRMSVRGSICFWCTEHGLWYEVSVLSGKDDGLWRVGETKTLVF